jgi:hypothetical protein
MADEQSQTMVRIELIARSGLAPHVAWVEIPYCQGEAPTAVIWEGRVFQRYVSEGAELRDGDVYRECFAVRAVRQMDAGLEQRS